MNYIIQCLCLGDTGIGKSYWLSHEILHRTNQDEIPTECIQFEVSLWKSPITQNWFKFQWWTLSGQERFFPITEKCLKRGDWLFYFFHPHSYESMVAMEGWMKKRQDSSPFFIIAYINPNYKTQEGYQDTWLEEKKREWMEKSGFVGYLDWKKTTVHEMFEKMEHYLFRSKWIEMEDETVSSKCCCFG